MGEELSAASRHQCSEHLTILRISLVNNIAEKLTGEIHGVVLVGHRRDGTVVVKTCFLGVVVIEPACESPVLRAVPVTDMRNLKMFVKIFKSLYLNLYEYLNLI